MPTRHRSNPRRPGHTPVDWLVPCPTCKAQPPDPCVISVGPNKGCELSEDKTHTRRNRVYRRRERWRHGDEMPPDEQLGVAPAEFGQSTKKPMAGQAELF